MAVGEIFNSLGPASSIASGIGEGVSRCFVEGGTRWRGFFLEVFLLKIENKFRMSNGLYSGITILTWGRVCFRAAALWGFFPLAFCAM
jgi:hypothetical protein